MSSVVTEAEVAGRLRELEAELDLFEPTFDGVSVWQLLRFPVAGELAWAGPRGLAGPPAASRTELAARGASDWARYARLPRARILAKTFASGLAELQADGRYRDVFFDDVLDAAGTHVKLEARNARGRPRAASLPSAATTAGIDLGVRVLSRIRPTGEAREAARFFGEVISTRLGLTRFGPAAVEQRLLYHRWAKCQYRRVLERVRPELVLVADTGEFELFAAAKEQGVRCVELQHGLFTRNHPDALGATAVAQRARLIVPDALFLFGAYWEDELRAGGFYGDELRVTGSPRIDRFRARRALARERDGGARRVLVTTQGLATEELAGLLAATARLARAAGRDLQVDLKLHPIYDSSSKAIYDEALAGVAGVRVLASEEPPSTLELLSVADAHVSISSACHYEALGLGVPTIVVPLPGHEEVLPLVEAGDAALAETPAELLRLLEDPPDVPRKVSHRYYRPGALERIAAELGGQPSCS